MSGRDKPGHSAKRCYHRFDVTYRNNTPKSNNLHGLMTITIATLEFDWHPNTGVAHHLTNNMANLNMQSDDYIGINQVLIGNGAGLHISQIGYSLITHSKTPFMLKQLLLIPDIKKKLVSFQKFCSDNLVYFEFHDRFFLIKDYSRKILHRDTFKDGLYSFFSLPNTFPPHALTTMRASYQLWHNWLGYALFPVIQKSFSAFMLPFANRRLLVCLKCQLARSNQLSFKTNNHKFVHLLDIMHTNVWGSPPILSNNGAQYNALNSYVCFL